MGRSLPDSVMDGIRSLLERLGAAAGRRPGCARSSRRSATSSGSARPSWCWAASASVRARRLARPVRSAPPSTPARRPGAIPAAARAREACSAPSRPRRSGSRARSSPSPSRPCRCRPGQMGPRLLRNFVRDARNQVALGIFLGTFAYALDGAAHGADRVRALLRPAPRRHGRGGAGAGVPRHAGVVRPPRRGFDQRRTRGRHGARRPLRRHRGARPRPRLRPPPPASKPLAGARRHRHGQPPPPGRRRGPGIADWAAAHGVAVRMRVRPGDFVPTGAAVAVVSAAVDGRCAQVFEDALTFGRQHHRAAGHRIFRAPAQRDRRARPVAGHQRPLHGGRRGELLRRRAVPPGSSPSCPPAPCRAAAGSS